ncbi:TasA family protein [Carnobacterium alterfunditum]|uniref:TasA family protein n=1 Tax=Carnobacterium alterfunditum TaxID=28230 RepID=UPI003592FE44
MKKTSTNNRRKKLPLLLGALLIISVAAYGTRAYFSDSAEQQANIALELGNVNISASEGQNWKYTPLTSGGNLDTGNAKNTKLGATLETDNSIIDATTISKVRPGDSFVRTFKFKNDGSLDVKIDLESNIPSGVSPFVVDIKDLNSTEILPAGSTKEYIVSITVPLTVGNEFNDNQAVGLSRDKIAVDYINSNLTVKAVQTNDDSITVVK